MSSRTHYASSDQKDETRSVVTLANATGTNIPERQLRLRRSPVVDTAGRACHWRRRFRGKKEKFQDICASFCYQGNYETQTTNGRDYRQVQA